MKTTRNDNFKDSRALKHEDENHKEKYKKTDTVKVKTDAINTNLVKVNTFRVTSRSVNSLFLLLRTFVSEMLVSVFVLLSVLACVCAKEQKFALEPQDQSALVGSRVTLPCRVVNKVGQLQWTKDDFGLGTHRHLNGYERYKMVGSDEEGDYSLDIRDVTLDDDALYQCQVSSGPKGEQPIRSRYAHLIVLMPPDPPKILQAPTLQTIEDRDVDLECISTGGKPAAEITWVDSEGGVLTQGVTYNVEPMSDGRRFTARSILRLRPRRHHHNQTLTCQAQNTADRAYRSATIRLEVQYAPKVRVFIKSPLKRMISEGENLIISCQASANPNNLTYKWYVNNEQIEGKTDNELVLRNISRKYNEATVKCEVYNSVGKSADTKSLEIAYGPSIKESPQNVEGELGSLAILNCLVDGHPQPKIMWLRYENDRVIRVGKSSNLTLTITQQSAGQYWCRGSVEGHQDVEAMAMVYLRGPPKIISNETQYGVIGDSVKIECISFSVPKPDYIVWSYEGQEINSFHNQEYAFLEEALADKLTKSTLIIRRSETRHYGPYNCTVANSYGMDSILINILPDKSLPIIFIVSGCSSTAIILVMVMLIIMLCHRKTKSEKKPDITDVGKTCPDRFKDSDRNSNVSDLKLELRQVEGNCDLEHSNGGSVTDLHPTTRLTSNLGLPLAGPVPLPDVGHDNELMKQYQRYSGDFNQAINNLNFKAHGQSNGYVPYVDYTRDYAPPDSLSGSLTRSVHGSEYPSQCSSLHRQASCGRIAGVVGPDVIPMNPGMMSAGIDVRYAATYGNPYLRGSGSISYVPQANPNSGAKHPPPPYYSIRNSSLHVPGSVSSPSSSLSSRPSTSPLASASSTNSSAQPQVPKPCPQSENLYIRPHTSQGNSVNNQITCKGSQTAGTHV